MCARTPRRFGMLVGKSTSRQRIIIMKASALCPMVAASDEGNRQSLWMLKSPRIAIWRLGSVEVNVRMFDRSQKSVPCY